MRVSWVLWLGGEEMVLDGQAGGYCLSTPSIDTCWFCEHAPVCSIPVE